MKRIDHITIQALCHATEDENKVLDALGRLYPAFGKRRAAGHFGNPIYIFEAHLTKKREITGLIQLLQDRLPELDIERRIDEKGNLFIRLDSQELYQGSFTLRDSGEVKIIIHIQSHPFRLEDAIAYAEEIFSH